MDINCKKSIIDSLYEKYKDDFGMWSVHLDDMSSEELPFEIEDWMYDYAMEKQKENVICEGDFVVTRENLMPWETYGGIVYVDTMEIKEPVEVEEIEFTWITLKLNQGYIYTQQMLKKVKL